MKIEKVKSLFFVLATIIAAALLGVAFLKFIFPVALPFLLSYSIACLTTRPAIFLEKRLNIKRRYLRLIISLLSLALLFLAVFLFGKYSGVTLFNEIENMLESGGVERLIERIIAPIEAVLGDKMPDELESEIINAIKGLFSSVLSSLGGAVTSVVAFIPKMFLFLVITLISMVYFSLDLELVNKKIKSLLPSSLSEKLVKLREKFLSVGVKYVYSYLLIMTITFSVVFLGFLILKIRHGALLALIIAFCDIFPVIGVGTVLIPWAVIELIIGNTGRGAGLIILFVINELIRQFSEPKILGKNLNMHPIITLILIYALVSFFGVAGLMLIPIFTVIINSYADSL